MIFAVEQKGEKMITIDMEMPKSCLECPMYDNYNYYCTLYSFGIPVRYNRDGSTRPEWCELEELPKCEDAVSRQAAIDALDCINGVEEVLKSLPSARPEPKITHCNACKHWKQTTGEMRGFGLGECDFFGIKLVTCNGFCYWAERRNNG